MRRSMRFALMAIVLAAASMAHGGIMDLFRGAPTTGVTGFNFNYQIYAGEQNGLLQVFDDGRQTYFQFRDIDLRRAPVVWIENSAGERTPVSVEATQPYLVVNVVADKFVLKLGGQRGAALAKVVRLEPPPSAPRRIGDEQEPAPVLESDVRLIANKETPAAPKTMGGCNAAPPPAAPVKLIDVPFAAKAVTPTRRAREELTALAAQLRGRVIVRGLPSASGNAAQALMRAQQLRQLLIRAGVPASRIDVETGARPKPGGRGVFLSEIRHGESFGGFVLLGEPGC